VRVGDGDLVVGVGAGHDHHPANVGDGHMVDPNIASTVECDGIAALERKDNVRRPSYKTTAPPP
jgi:hypothetical protein